MGGDNLVACETTAEANALPALRALALAQVHIGDDAALNSLDAIRFDGVDAFCQIDPNGDMNDQICDEDISFLVASACEESMLPALPHLRCGHAQ